MAGSCPLHRPLRDGAAVRCPPCPPWARRDHRRSRKDARAIAAGRPPGGVVLDPLAGTSTTRLAASRVGRTYIGIAPGSSSYQPYLTHSGGSRPKRRAGGEADGQRVPVLGRKAGGEAVRASRYQR
ncbi:DNA methyltransferase [Pseudofrankia sp. BMG5.37]|uniref:DNA methyltransferase n=1 Tax=Pseudofrankia sp. BMG5.37 TaxID=3050035 RepID=UPI0028958644|nr:DNA methyltransferase [Pseudofrankia sp. BMG5.37]MDT3442132.1 DNA methyltransferase [Pseudofrankia sp. BMG5.37]